MEWTDIIQKRHTTFAWDETRIPSKDDIISVLQEVYQHIPSKNLQFPYQVRLLRNDDYAIKKEIFSICKRNGHATEEEDRGNPQVLAPWLLGMNSRYVSDLEVRYETESKRGLYNGLGAGQVRDNDPNGYQSRSENLEIGIFLGYVMLALANRGIQSGVCQNICNDFERASEIFKLAEDERAMEFRFIMGIGYGKDSSADARYFDPRINKMKAIPFPPDRVEEVYPRPDFEDIFKIL